MTRLSREEISFLKSQGISLNEVFDATGLKRNEYIERMKTGNYTVACGTKPCKAGSHRLRTRSGHCMQCNPVSYVYSIRHHSNQYLYIAYSSLSNLVKIGVTANLSQREAALKKQKYGGWGDWKIISFKKILNAGVVESKIHSKLKSFQFKSSTYKDSHDQETYELFSCSLSEATSAFECFTKNK